MEGGRSVTFVTFRVANQAASGKRSNRFASGTSA